MASAKREHVVLEVSGRDDGVTGARDERERLGDAPSPPRFRRRKGEAPRVATSRAKPDAAS